MFVLQLLSGQRLILSRGWQRPACLYHVPQCGDVRRDVCDCLLLGTCSGKRLRALTEIKNYVRSETSCLTMLFVRLTCLVPNFWVFFAPAYHWCKSSLWVRCEAGVKCDKIPCCTPFFEDLALGVVVQPSHQVTVGVGWENLGWCNYFSFPLLWRSCD